MIEPTGNLSTDLLRYGSRIKKTIVVRVTNDVMTLLINESVFAVEPDTLSSPLWGSHSTLGWNFT
jgi:hypothetical protein